MKYIPEKVKNRCGKVIFSDEMYLSMFKEVLLFFSYGVILKVEHIPYKSCYEVIMVNAFFDIINVGEEIPQYNINFDTTQGFSIHCERKK